MLMSQSRDLVVSVQHPVVSVQRFRYLTGPDAGSGLDTT